MILYSLCVCIYKKKDIRDRYGIEGESIDEILTLQGVLQHSVIELTLRFDAIYEV